MRCPYCYGPISRVRGLDKSQPENRDRIFYRCLLCSADFVVTGDSLLSNKARQADQGRSQLQPVWPRVIG